MSSRFATTSNSTSAVSFDRVKTVEPSLRVVTRRARRSTASCCGLGVVRRHVRRRRSCGEGHNVQPCKIRKARLSRCRLHGPASATWLPVPAAPMEAIRWFDKLRNLSGSKPEFRIADARELTRLLFVMATVWPVIMAMTDGSVSSRSTKWRAAWRVEDLGAVSDSESRGMTRASRCRRSRRGPGARHDHGPRPPGRAQLHPQGWRDERRAAVGSG